MLYKKIKEMNSIAYLTLMSIVQGVALSFFTEIVIKEYTGYSSSSWVMVMASLFVLVLTWFEYLKGVTLFVWRYDFIDSCIPFLFFIVEVCLIQTMSAKEGWWFFWMFMFCTLALIAFLNQYFKARKENENDNIRRFIGKKEFRPMWFSVGSAILFMCFWRWRNDANEMVLAVISLGMLLWFTMLSSSDWRHANNYAKSMRQTQGR